MTDTERMKDDEYWEREQAQLQHDRIKRLQEKRFEASDEELEKVAEIGLGLYAGLVFTVVDDSDPKLSEETLERFCQQTLNPLLPVFIEYRQYLRAKKIASQAEKLRNLLSPRVEADLLTALKALAPAPQRSRSLKSFVIERIAAALDKTSSRAGRSFDIQMIAGYLLGEYDADRKFRPDTISHALEGTPYRRQYWSDSAQTAHD